MAQSVLTRKTGVIVGDDVLNLFKYAQEKKFAIPAIVSSLSPNIPYYMDLRVIRMSLLPLPSTLPSRQPAMPSHPSFCKCPKVVPHTLPERLV